MAMTDEQRRTLVRKQFDDGWTESDVEGYHDCLDGYFAGRVARGEWRRLWREANGFKTDADAILNAPAMK